MDSQLIPNTFVHEPLTDSAQVELTEKCDENGTGQISNHNYQMSELVVNTVNEESNDSQCVNNSEQTEYVVELKYDGENTQFELVPANVLVMDELVKRDDQKLAAPNSAFIIHCLNCDNLFEEADFFMHICDFDENKVLVKDEQEVVIKTEIPEELLCIRQLRENNAFIRKWLKEELKMDLSRSSKKDGPHECTICERKFVHESGLSRHMDKHALDLIPTATNPNNSTLKVLTKCLICGRILFSAEEAFKHVHEDHEVFQSEMEDENKSIEDEGIEDITSDNRESITEYAAELLESYKKDDRNVIPHIKVVILSTLLQCEFCDHSFSQVSDLLIHEASHDPLAGFSCVSCGISVQTIKDIVLHWQTECAYVKDQNRKNILLHKHLVCNVCENKFNSHDHLLEHRYSSLHLFPRLSKDSRKMLIGCEYCGVFFENAESLLKHHDENHAKKTKKEPTTRYRQYLCDVCGKSYTQSSHLWQHLRFHRGVKPFACKEAGCNRRFTIRPDLNDHIRKCHTGERPYHCLVCGKRFLTGSVFYQHRLIHRGERRYGCDECGKRFYRADALKNHQRIHTGEKPYNCMYCNKNFRQRGDRDKHIKARHANWDANARRLLSNPKVRTQNVGDVVYVGNVPFPTSMFKPILRDIDENVN